MLELLKEKFKKVPASLYVMALGFAGIITVITLRQNHESKRQAAFLSLYQEYEKQGSGELLEKLVRTSEASSTLRKRFGPKIFQEMVLFRPDIFTRAWLKEPIKIKDNYDKFSEGSILIVENKLEDALKKGESLEKEISLEDSPVLFAFNAFRLAVLHDKLGHQQEAHDRFAFILKQDKVKKTLDEAYRFESLTVSDYIENRLIDLSLDK